MPLRQRKKTVLSRGKQQYFVRSQRRNDLSFERKAFPAFIFSLRPGACRTSQVNKLLLQVKHDADNETFAKSKHWMIVVVRLRSQRCGKIRQCYKKRHMQFSKGQKLTDEEEEEFTTSFIISTRVRFRIPTIC